MMKNILFLIALFSFFAGRATHMAGGEISYTHLNGLSYYVQVKIYRDCLGTPHAGSISLNTYSASLGQNINTNLGLNLLQGYNVSAFCPGVITSCNGGNYPGYEVCIYEGNVTLTGQASDWVFSTSHCCRNNAICNITNPGSQNFGLMSTLNNSAPVNDNNSVQFMQGDQLIFNTNQTYNINFIANDIDGDSLVYSLATPITTITNGVPNYCSFAPGYNVANPFTGSFSLNSMTGNMTFNCATQCAYVLALKVQEYRNGVLVGSTVKDMHFSFIGGTPNNLPTLSGVNGTANYYTTVHVCAGNSLNFTVNSGDLDLADSVFISMNNNNIPGSTLSMSNAAQPVATFSWTPTVADIRPQPYLLGLKAKDNHCDLLGSQNFAYLIYVTQCNVDTVWPGDANADFIVNNYDVLNIGIANNTSGIVRPGATTNWTAQYCSNWVDTFINGINYKHADCDGNGTVNNTDLGVVTLNYGQFHLKNENIGRYKTRGLPDLFFDTNGLQAIPGTTLQIPVHLGVLASPMNNIYGIAGKILVSNTLSNNITLSNPTSWLGVAANSFLFQKNIGGYNATDFTLVRNNQQQINGYGQIATLEVPIDASAIVGSDLILQFANLKLIDANGNEISDYNVLNDTLKISWPTQINPIETNNKIAVYPNPISNILTIENLDPALSNYQINIVNVTGNSIYNCTLAEKKKIINTESFSKGMYFIQIKNEMQKIYTFKITK